MDDRLDASVKRILQQNRRAAQEVQTLSDEAILLQKENEVLLGERKQLLQVRCLCWHATGLQLCFAFWAASCCHQLIIHNNNSHSHPSAQISSRYIYAQELDMKVQLEKGFVVRSAKQTREIKDASNKVLALEKTLQDFVEDFEKERQFMRDQWETASAQMTQEVDGYKRLLDVRPSCAACTSGASRAGISTPLVLSAPQKLRQMHVEGPNSTVCGACSSR